MSPFVGYALVALELSIKDHLDYGILPHQQAVVKKGSMVEVKVRGCKRRGFVVGLLAQSAHKKILPIEQVLGAESPIDPALFDLGLWISRYYACPLALALRGMLPPGVRKSMQPKQQLFIQRAKTRPYILQAMRELTEQHPAQALVLQEMLKVKKGLLLTQLLEKTGGSRSPIESLEKKGFLQVTQLTLHRSPIQDAEYFRTKPKRLNPEQQLALDRICQSLQTERFDAHLLHGVTGSGKTEVYLQAIDKALSLQKGTIMLVPEISLTAQTIERFQSRFEGNIAILHHRLSEGMRFDEWTRIQQGKARIVIGARSAIFSPVKNIGLIIVDEEHEMSYKQSEETPCYHARDVAVMRAHMEKACVVLGSATPSLESYCNALSGKYILSTLTLRADQARMPRVKIIDMKREYDRQHRISSFSEDLIAGIKKRIELKEQCLLFLNRRGYFTTQLCNQCSHVVGCPHCDVSLTFHFNENALSCHLCGYTLSPPPKTCPECRSADSLKYRGVGTEQIERALHAILPEVKTLRLDADTTRHKGSHEQILRDFRTGKADVLIGTQMIAKGLHFPAVTLVGVLNCDASLNIPDFRASEVVFQLITQVSGRAGRGQLPGEVLIQTCLPQNPLIAMASKGDFNAFYQSEIEVRKCFQYPPFTHFIKYTLSSTNESEAHDYANKLHSSLLQTLPANFHIHPVIPAGHAKVKDRYRFQFLVRGPSVIFVNQAMQGVLSRLAFPRGLFLHTDVDPSSTFF